MENQFEMVFAIVNSGYTEEVMDAYQEFMDEMQTDQKKTSKEKQEEKLKCFIVSNNSLEAIKLTEYLRAENINCEFDLTNKKFVKQLEKASKVAKYALILGEDELAQNKVTVKNLETSEQKLVNREEVIATIC